MGRQEAVVLCMMHTYILTAEQLFRGPHESITSHFLLVLYEKNRWAGNGGGVGGGSAAHLTPSEVAKAGRRAIAVRPQDVGDLMKVW